MNHTTLGDEVTLKKATRPSQSAYRAATAASVGSAIEAFDFIAYGTAAALVFNKEFFPALDPATGTLAAFGAFATGLLARPVGGLIFGHFGDRIGRKTMLMLSLVLMGGATVGIGLVPNYATIGISAAVLLVLFRIVQGIALGGEMGGAVLMAVEHAPVGRKAFFGSLPQMGTPVGLLLSTGAFHLFSQLPDPSFLAWGWRIPFIASVLLIIVGYYIRRNVAESPEFSKVVTQKKAERVPLAQLLSHHKRPLFLAIGAKISEVTLFYTLVVFIVAYATSKLGFTRGEVLKAVMIGAALQIVTIPMFGLLADRIGARRVYFLGALLLAVCSLPMMTLIQSGSPTALAIAITLGLGINYSMMFAPQSALYTSQFPVNLRYSGISIGIQFAAAIGGGLAPIVASSLSTRYGGLEAVGFYLIGLALLAAACTALMRKAD